MAQATQSKASVKYGQFEVKFNDWAGRFETIRNWELESGESIASKARDYRAQLVQDMKDNGFKESTIGTELGLSKSEVAKLVTRATALKFELDTTLVQDLVDAGGNGITKAKIEAIASNTKLSKSDRKAQLVELGLPAKGTDRRDVKGGKAKPNKADLTAKDIKAIQAIAKRATDGKTNASAIYDYLLLAQDEVGSVHANQ